MNAALKARFVSIPHVALVESTRARARGNVISLQLGSIFGVRCWMLDVI